MIEILVTVGYILLCVLLFSLAIAIHEFGHFIVALKLGLKVERFSIGFGPAIWKKTVNGVEYRLSWIPLGGYVSIPDVDPEGTKALEGEKAAGGEGAAKKGKIPAWKELLVALAGPAMNVVLAVALAVVLSLIPSARFGQLTTEIGGFAPGSVAKEAGLRKGDVVVAIAGHPVNTWSELQTEVQITNGNPTEFLVRRPRALAETKALTLAGGAESGLSFDATAMVPVVEGFWEDSAAEAAGVCKGDRIVSFNGEPVDSVFALEMALQEAGAEAKATLGLRRGADLVTAELTPVKAKARVGDFWLLANCLQVFCATNVFLPHVESVAAGSPAEKAGFKAGDRIVSFGGAEVRTLDEFESACRRLEAGASAPVVVSRDIPAGDREYDEVTVVIAPKRNAASGAFFIEAVSVPNETGSVAWMPDRNPLRQLAWDAGSIFRVLKALVTPKEAKGTSKAVGGPVLIAEGIYKSMRRDFSDGLGFLRFLNTNLAVMNLLPIPVLDGGLILFALIAIVFRRRVPEKIVGWLSMGFMYLLLGLMALLIFSDTLRSWKIHHAEDPTEAIELVIPEGEYAL